MKKFAREFYHINFMGNVFGPILPLVAVCNTKQCLFNSYLNGNAFEKNVLNFSYEISMLTILKAKVFLQNTFNMSEISMSEICFNFNIQICLSLLCL